jgi:hypothetical protein
MGLYHHTSLNIFAQNLPFFLSTISLDVWDVGNLPVKEC